MTPDSDDLEQALQQNLEIRRELGAEIGKVDGIRPAQQGGGMVYRLGWVLYWACLALIVAWFLFLLFLNDFDLAKLLTEMSTDLASALLLLFIPILILYGLGRAFRYVLSGE
jgi:Gpi18-like mannosyltransferase